MCSAVADAIQFIFYNMLFCFHFVLHYLLVSYSSADLTTVEVLQPANLSHPSLVFGTCADVYPSIKDVRQENVVDLMLRQHRQPICLLFTIFLWGCHVWTKNYWRNGWDNNPILPFWCMFKCFFWMELLWHGHGHDRGRAWNMHLGVVEAPKWFVCQHAFRWSPTQP